MTAKISFSLSFCELVKFSLAVLEVSADVVFPIFFFKVLLAVAKLEGMLLCLLCGQ